MPGAEKYYLLGTNVYCEGGHPTRTYNAAYPVPDGCASVATGTTYPQY